MRIQYFVGPVQQRRTGGQIYHAELMRFLARENEVIDEVGVAEANRGNMFSANRWCWQRMRQCRAEIIVEDSYYAACQFTSNWLAKRWRSRIVVFVQAIPEDYTQWSRGQQAFHWVIMALFLRSADLVVTNSHYTSTQVISRYPVRAEKVTVLSPAGQRLPGERSRPVRTDSRVKRLLCVANIQPKKGQKYLVEAMHLLNQCNCHLTLVGGVKDSAYYDELFALISQYRLQDRVHLAGFLQGHALAAEYQAADIFVHPSVGEGYGMVVAEAMGWGLPIIASRVGGIPEIITDGVDGILMPAGDGEALAAAIEQVISDEGLASMLGANARARFEALPSWEEIGHKFQKLLRSLGRE